MSENQRFFAEAKAKMPVVGILRDIPAGAEKVCAETAAKAGLSIIEVTMNTPGAAEILTELRKVCEPLGIVTGAGTVRTMSDLKTAAKAGAQFIVSPTTFPKIIEETVKLGLPSVPGAATPTEVETAFLSGATCVKVFPVGAFGGPKYIKELRGPFRDIPLLACGGVSAENAKDYLDAGANMLAFGGSIFNAKLMQGGDWQEIGKRLKELLAAVEAWKASKPKPEKSSCKETLCQTKLRNYTAKAGE